MPLVATAGNNHVGQLGRCGPGDSFHVVHISGDLTQVSCGDSHTLVVTNLGTVYGWGRNTEGQLGFNPEEKSFCHPVRLGSLLSSVNVMKVAAGEGHTMLLTSDGEVLVLGSGSCGQHGNGQCSTVSWSPVKVWLNETISDISSGARTCFAVSTCGNVYGWGESVSGMFGVTSVVVPCVSVPTRLSIGPHRMRISRVIASQTFAVFITTTHEAVGSGSNSFGQLAGVEGEHTTSWKHLRYPQKVRDLACGQHHTIALLTNGRLVQLGNTRLSTGICFQAEGSQMIGVGAGRSTTFCWDGEGHLYASGKNHKGQLGLGKAAFSASLTRVPFKEPELQKLQVVSVSCGSSHSAVLLAERGSQDLSGFLAMEDMDVDEEEVAGRLGSIRAGWDEDIANVSFSRFSAKFHANGRNAALNSSQAEYPVVQVEASREEVEHDAFRNTKLMVTVSVVSVVMIAVGFYCARQRRRPL